MYNGANGKSRTDLNGNTHSLSFPVHAPGNGVLPTLRKTADPNSLMRLLLPSLNSALGFSRSGLGPEDTLTELLNHFNYILRLHGHENTHTRPFHTRIRIRPVWKEVPDV
ncbi:unnamed protein product [Bemisia tabaci]|uniref:Uncharacterized protein n=1 Tax=Bemisia tabaci TaxID=7038 RepID=A0A9P0AAG5_BEMTA|nr:unnamed protein product [Bemisia tabaci]